MRANKLTNWIFNPVYLVQNRVAKSLVDAISALSLENACCLDVGCGNRPYEYLFERGTYTGIDVASSGRPMSMKTPDSFYDGVNIPFDENSFDIVIATQVLEHVPNPLGLLIEMGRVCRMSGAIVVSLPFVYPEHEEPYDYFRFTRFGITELMSNAGLEVIAMKRDSGALDTIAILLNLYIINNCVPKIKGFGRLYSMLFCFPIQILAMLLSKLFPDQGGLYLNLVVTAKKNELNAC